jgi:hypothetical protein
MSAWRVNLEAPAEAQCQPRSKPSFGEFVGVAITQFDLDPTIFDGLVQPSTEIGISHIEEIIASKHAARSNFVLHENAEDLASYFVIRCHVSYPLRGSEATITQVEYHHKRRNELIPFLLRADEVIGMAPADLAITPDGAIARP